MGKHAQSRSRYTAWSHSRLFPARESGGGCRTEVGGSLCEEIIVENPTYVQQPLIQAVVDHLLGKSVCSCDGESATLTNWVMDKILNKL